MYNDENEELLNKALLDLVLAVKQNTELQKENQRLKQEMEALKSAKKKN